MASEWERFWQETLGKVLSRSIQNEQGCSIYQTKELYDLSQQLPVDMRPVLLDTIQQFVNAVIMSYTCDRYIIGCYMLFSLEDRSQLMVENLPDILLNVLPSVQSVQAPIIKYTLVKPEATTSNQVLPIILSSPDRKYVNSTVHKLSAEELHSLPSLKSQIVNCNDTIITVNSQDSHDPISSTQVNKEVSFSVKTSTDVSCPEAQVLGETLILDIVPEGITTRECSSSMENSCLTVETLSNASDTDNISSDIVMRCEVRNTGNIPPQCEGEDSFTKDNSVMEQQDNALLESPQTEMREFRVLAASSTTEVVEDAAKTRNLRISAQTDCAQLPLNVSPPAEHLPKETKMPDEIAGTEAEMTDIGVASNCTGDEECISSDGDSHVKDNSLAANAGPPNDGHEYEQLDNINQTYDMPVPVTEMETSVNLPPASHPEIIVNGCHKIESRQETPKDEGERPNTNCKPTSPPDDGGEIQISMSNSSDDVDETMMKDDTGEEDNVDYYCFYCDTPDDKLTMSGLVQHFRKCHLVDEENKVTLQCKMCPKKYVTGRPVRSSVYFSILSCLNHMVEKHDVVVPDFAKLYRCTSCSYTTLIYPSFMRHCSQHDSSLSPCDTCGKLLKPLSLKNHVRTCGTVQPESEREGFDCQLCGQSFGSKGSLTLHVARKHNNQQLQLCQSCPASFFAKADLERHMFSQHGVNISKRKVDTCPICNFQTLEGSQLRKHMKNHEFGLFPCSECGKVFGTEKRLKSHLMTHNAKKKHKCPNCDYVTYRRYHLERHLSVMHGGVSWKCHLCNTTTFASTNLQKHFDSKHPGETVHPDFNQLSLPAKGMKPESIQSGSNS